MDFGMEADVKLISLLDLQKQWELVSVIVL
jgi:hypothetical protein